MAMAVARAAGRSQDGTVKVAPTTKYQTAGEFDLKSAINFNIDLISMQKLYHDEINLKL